MVQTHPVLLCALPGFCPPPVIHCLTTERLRLLLTLPLIHLRRIPRRLTHEPGNPRTRAHGSCLLYRFLATSSELRFCRRMSRPCQPCPPIATAILHGAAVQEQCLEAGTTSTHNSRTFCRVLSSLLTIRT
ncbi:hypothetical protein FKP32DRAFT_1148278 [Trametes sanguinea]|nr:hypothetical protein FKP32DRAFT_1148278 [Trametes sanguinea]